MRRCRLYFYGVSPIVESVRVRESGYLLKNSRKPIAFSTQKGYIKVSR